MLKLTKRNNSANWYIRGTIRGQGIDESTGTSDRKAAEEILAKRAHEVLQESIHGKRVTTTFAKASISYMQLCGERRFMAPILHKIGNVNVNKLKQEHIDQVALDLYPDAAMSTRVRQVYTPISSVLKHAAQRGWCDDWTIKRPKHDNERVRWLTKDEAERLIAACAPHLKPLVIFLLYTGARCGEALWLEWKNVDLERKHVQFIDTKNGTSRGVPLHERVVETLNGLDVRDRSAVFRTHKGRPYRPPDSGDDGDTSAGSRIKVAFGNAVKRAGIADFRPHDCRHTFATWHYQRNRDLGALQRLGGWKTLQMVLRYAHTNVAELGASIDNL